ALGEQAVALVTGEEKIKPPNPRFWVSTVEAMPRDLDVAFLAVDEIQLGADLERGHVFTDRMLHRRGREETLVLGAATMRPLVETDAIGMGLNLDVDHVAFAADRKFDGYQFRRLNAAELAQIAGRAGRASRDGTFGTTGRCPPFEPELVQALESHRFEPVKVLQWRNTDLDFSSLGALQASLAATPT